MTSTLRSKILLNFSAIMLASLSAEATEVVLKAKVDVKGSIVRLGDVAGVKSADDRRAASLKDLALFPSPTPGRVRTLHIRELRELLLLNGIAIDDVRFEGSRLVRVGASREIQAQPTTPPTARSSPKFVVAVRPLKRGDILRAVDVELRSLDEPPRRMKAATLPQNVIGREVLRSFSAGQPIDEHQLRRPLLVRRGQAVQVQAKAAGVVVTTTARAMDDGAAGDIIVLQSLENREKYSAYVTGLQRAEIYVSGIRAVDTRPVVSQLPVRPNLK